ncbi:hypothetical protein P12x_001061 [Tundrisphaera lichenicola]|uniref:hypothetical protein n=1 Tax=Tundrisphaera lichenicola TaxID=2029860 RepID=UPI003EC09BAF
MSRAAWALRSVGVWVAGLAVAGTASIAAEPSMPGLPPLPMEIAPAVPVNLSDSPMPAPSPTMDDSRIARVQFPPIEEPAPTGLRPLNEPSYPGPVVSPMGDLGATFRQVKMEPPMGFAGKSGILKTEPQVSADFVPIEDRWRIGYPEWDRYGRGHPLLDDYPYVPGRAINPFRQNVLKGDYPILGQHTFMELTGSTLSFMEYRRIPTQTTPFESTARANQFPFFGRPNQFFYTQFFNISLDLFHGDAAFKPVDWRIKITPVFNVNSLAVSELAQVSPNVKQGTYRNRTFFSLQEFFGEVKLADTSPYYDFTSARVGSQLFVSDFRGFIFADVNRGARIFGTRNANRDQYNLVYFRQFEKDTNSGLNSFHDRGQNVFIANYYRQDFLFPGYTAQASIHYNNDNPTFKINKNRFLNRPDPAGIYQRHQVDAVYFGFTGDGHWNRFNVTNAFYWVVGRDSLNPLANRSQLISAQFAAIELSYDRDWMRFKTAALFASGDSDINNGHASGFDSILDSQVFAGGIFSYLQRQAIPIFGVNLVNLGSFLPDLRSSKIQGQSNFVNPGQVLFNVGQEMDITPKLKMVNNMNFLQFQQVNVLKQFLYAGRIHHGIGLDISSGFEYRPFLNDAAVVVAGVNTLLPGLGFRDIYSNFGRRVDTPVSAFASLVLAF